MRDATQRDDTSSSIASLDSRARFASRRRARVSFRLPSRARALFFFPTPFPRSFTPSTRSSLPKICWFGMAFPDSYSCTICGFSLICCANCACVSFFARRPCKMAFFTSTLTVLCVKFSSSSSNLSAFLPAPSLSSSCSPPRPREAPRRPPWDLSPPSSTHRPRRSADASRS